MSENDQESFSLANGDLNIDTQFPSHQSLLNVSIPNATLGTVRSAQISNFRFECLYITDDSIPSFFELIEGRNKSKSHIESTARTFINFVTQFDEILVISGQNLDLLESLWTGVDRSNPEIRLGEFFVLIEVNWYFNFSWDIQREMSCLAVSRTAFSALKKAANFRVKHKGIENIEKSKRVCDEQILRDCVECLASGSPWQVLLAAISSTLVTVYPFPPRKRSDFIPAVKALRFGHIEESRVSAFIRKFLLRKMWAPKKRLSNREMIAATKAGLTPNEAIKMGQPKHNDMLFKRVSECQKRITETQSHVDEHCARCLLSPEQDMSKLGHGYLDQRNEPEVSIHNTVLVASTKAADGSDFKSLDEADICVFGLTELSELGESDLFATMIEGMARPDSLIFHTIQFSPRDSRASDCDIKYNLPLPYRLPTQNERSRIASWVRELWGSPPELKDGSLRYSSEWKNSREFMFLLRIGHSEEEASLLLTHKPWPSNLNGRNTIEIIKVINKKNIYRHDYSTLRKKSRIAGDNIVRRFASWENGRDFLNGEYPYQAGLLNLLPGRRGEGINQTI
ncbi:hypothetical protein N7540_006267 [Penicillium herquei]|nr:hypothetical protein N7540_006267 [Penicillium herquei]